jgi:hypothetical protein
MVKLLAIAHPVSFYSRNVVPVPIHAELKALIRSFPQQIRIVLFKKVILYFVHGPNLLKLISFGNCFYSRVHVNRIRKKTYPVGPPGKVSQTAAHPTVILIFPSRS